MSMNLPEVLYTPDSSTGRNVMDNSKYLKIKKIQRYMTLALVLFASYAGISLCQRFAIVRVPSHWQIDRVHPGCYLLVDWKFQKGRAIVADDLVLYDDNAHLQLARVVSAGTNSLSQSSQNVEHLPFSQTTPQYYLLQIPNARPDRVLVWIRTETIRGRVLMILFDSRERLLPKTLYGLIS